MLLGELQAVAHRCPLRGERRVPHHTAAAVHPAHRAVLLLQDAFRRPFFGGRRRYERDALAAWRRRRRRRRMRDGGGGGGAELCWLVAGFILLRHVDAVELRETPGHRRYRRLRRDVLHWHGGSGLCCERFRDERRGVFPTAQFHARWRFLRATPGGHIDGGGLFEKPLQGVVGGRRGGDALQRNGVTTGGWDACRRGRRRNVFLVGAAEPGLDGGVLRVVPGRVHARRHHGNGRLAMRRERRGLRRRHHQGAVGGHAVHRHRADAFLHAAAAAAAAGNATDGRRIAPDNTTRVTVAGGVVVCTSQTGVHQLAADGGVEAGERLRLLALQPRLVLAQALLEQAPAAARLTHAAALQLRDRHRHAVAAVARHLAVDASRRPEPRRADHPPAANVAPRRHETLRIGCKRDDQHSP